jgi:peroxin-11B
LYRTNNVPTAIAPYTTLKNQLGLTRKILRVGKFVEHFKLASELYKASEKIRAGGGDLILQYLAIMRQLGYGFYMTFDMLTVLDATGVRKSAAAKRLQEQAYKAWLFGLAASTLSGIYSHYLLTQRARTITEKDGEGRAEAEKTEKYKLMARPLLCPLIPPPDNAVI